MKRVKLLKSYLSHKAGEVCEFNDARAEKLIAMGRAVPEGDASDGARKVGKPQQSAKDSAAVKGDKQ